MGGAGARARNEGDHKQSSGFLLVVDARGRATEAMQEVVALNDMAYESSTSTLVLADDSISDAQVCAPRASRSTCE